MQSVEIGSDYVKVTTAADANAYLARVILGRNSTLIRAQAVAEMGYLAGGRAPVPWGLSILRIGDMRGRLGGQTVTFLEQPDGYWEGSFGNGVSGDLSLQATNSQGYTDYFPPLGGSEPPLVTIGSIPAGGKIAAMDVDKSTLTQGRDSSVQLSVRLSTPLAAGPANKYKVEVSTGHSTIEMTGDAARLNYTATVPVTYPNEQHSKLNLTVTVYEDNRSVDYPVSCGLLLRLPSYIIQDVDAHPIAVAGGESATVAVKTLDFEYGEEYQLKLVDQAGTSGNFFALDFDSLDHSSCGLPVINDPGHSGGSDYQDNIAGNDSIVAHIGDYITTKTGGMTGPTKHGIDERLAGINPLLTLQEWEDLKRPDTKQICIMPICERIERASGRTDLRIVSFGIFFLESRLEGNDTVIGTLHR